MQELNKLFHVSNVKEMKIREPKLRDRTLAGKGMGKFEFFLPLLRIYQRLLENEMGQNDQFLTFDPLQACEYLQLSEQLVNSSTRRNKS